MTSYGVTTTSTATTIDGRHVSRWRRAGPRGALWVCGRYRRAESVTSEWRTLEVIPSDSTHVTVHGLRPSSTYIFTVLARSKVSSPRPAQGQFSNVVNASTKGPSFLPLPFVIGDRSPWWLTVASGVVGVRIVVGVCNRSQMRTSKCTCLIFGVSIGLDAG